MSDAIHFGVLDSLLDPFSQCLDVDSARRMVEWRVASDVQERVDLLAERANEGLLSDEERAEYEAIVNASDFIAILQLKASRALGPNAPQRSTP